MRMRKMGVLSADLRLETCENIIINVVWVIDYFLVKLRQMKCLGQLLTLACVIGIYLIAIFKGRDFIF